MPIRVDAYTTGGLASGTLARSGHLREVLDEDGELTLERVRWRPLDGAAVQPSPDVTIQIDDVLIAVADDEPSIAIHATWHTVRLEIGPYVVEGDMPTLPGFDPGRALTRPSGEFLQLRDVRLGRRDTTGEAVPPVAIGHHALINRYLVESVEADLMLGFFFPGATMTSRDPADPGALPSPAASHAG